jgi:Asp-tRNA(Asn)/Glu-tRNA(Gln) amidotransferase B subunit
MRTEQASRKYTYQRGCGVVTTITAYEIAAQLTQPGMTDAERRRVSEILSLEKDAAYAFISDHDGLTITIRRVS